MTDFGQGSLSTARRLKERLIGIFRKASRETSVAPVEPRRTVLNLGFSPVQPKKRVALVYLNDYYFDDQKRIRITHTNQTEAMVYHEVLLRAGFVVDSFDCRRNELPEECKQPDRYSIVLGFGEVFRALCKTSPGAKKVLLLTENLPSFADLQEKKRVTSYNLRTGGAARIVRSHQFFRDEDVSSADEVLCYGEASLLQSSTQVIHVVTPTGLISPTFSLEVALQLRSPSHFIWFGSTGALHKGLDLAVEAIVLAPELSLDIFGASSSELDELPATKRMIEDSGNVGSRGFVRVDSDEFVTRVAQKAYFMLLPSCSEAMSTAVLTGMRHGMIPVVYVGNGFTRIRDYCFDLPSESSEEISAFLRQLSRTSRTELDFLSARVREWAQANATLENFEKTVGLLVEKWFAETGRG